MGDRNGLSPRARAFSVAALLQLTDVTGHKSGARCCPVTASDGRSAVSDDNAGSFNPGAVGVGNGATNVHPYHALYDPATDRLLPPPCQAGESTSAQANRGIWSRDPSGQAIGSTEVSRVSTEGSPPHWSGIIGSSGHLKQLASSSDHAPEVGSSPGPARHGLKFQSLEERLGAPQTVDPTSHCSQSITTKSTRAPRAEHNDRLSSNHTVSNSLAIDTAPGPDSTSETGGGSPSPTGDAQGPTTEPEERASDSGTASGDELDPDGANKLSTPRGPPAHWPTAPNCRPQQCAVSGMPEGTATVTAAAAEEAIARLRPGPRRDGGDPLTGDPGSGGGGGDPDRPSPREPTVAEREQAPRLPETAGAEQEEPKDPALAKLGITAELCSRDLWLEFHEHGTEMIITKMGRRMFPTVKVRLHGLRPTDSYIVYMDIVPEDDKRYRYIYHSSEWAVAGPGDAVGAQNRYVHPDSPASGRLWTSQGIVAFDKLKLTNRRIACSPAQISLHSMQKYRPRVHVQWTDDLVTPVEQQIDMRKSLTFSFRETEFITVTAYQNQEITRLKIASNPFAKGFRDIPASKRQHSPSSDSSSSSGGAGQKVPKRARQAAPPSSGLWNYSYPLPATHPPLFCIDPFSPITLLQSYSFQLQSQQYEKR